MKAPELNAKQKEFIKENTEKIKNMNKVELDKYVHGLYDSKELMLDKLFKKLKEAIDERIFEINSFHSPEIYGGASAVYSTIEYED